MSREANLDRRAMLAAGLIAPALAVAGRAAAQTPALVIPVDPVAELRLHNDWPWLGRYRDANATDAALPPGRRRVVFMGDSITQGWVGKHPAFFTDNGFLGRGISGQTTSQMLVRFWPDVIALKPAAVHILAGTNDIAENSGPYDPAATCDNFRTMAALARANRIKVVLGAITPASIYPWRQALHPAAEIPKFNAWLAAFARSEGHGFADYTAAMDDGHAAMKSGLAYDEVHPTAEGYTVMEAVALKALQAFRR